MGPLGENNLLPAGEYCRIIHSLQTAVDDEAIQGSPRPAAQTYKERTDCVQETKWEPCRICRSQPLTERCCCLCSMQDRCWEMLISVVPT